jgi:hypothetical protein
VGMIISNSPINKIKYAPDTIMAILSILCTWDWFSAVSALIVSMIRLIIAELGSKFTQDSALGLPYGTANCSSGSASKTTRIF